MHKRCKIKCDALDDDVRGLRATILRTSENVNSRRKRGAGGQLRKKTPKTTASDHRYSTSKHAMYRVYSLKTVEWFCCVCDVAVALSLSLPPSLFVVDCCWFEFVVKTRFCYCGLLDWLYRTYDSHSITYGWRWPCFAFSFCILSLVCIFFLLFYFFSLLFYFITLLWFVLSFVYTFWKTNRKKRNKPV